MAGGPGAFDTLTASEQLEFAVYVGSDSGSDSDGDDDSDDDDDAWADAEEPLDVDAQEFVAKLGNIDDNNLIAYDQVCPPAPRPHRRGGKCARSQAGRRAWSPSRRP